MDRIEISINEIKQHLENEAEFIIKTTENIEIIEAVERMRVSYFKYYNLLIQQDN